MTTVAKQTGDSFLRRAFSFLAIRLVARPVLRRESSTQYRGLKITVHPGVFHPGLYFSSRLLADGLLGFDLAGKKVLDMGTGTGIIGMSAARKGAQVLSVDISEKALQCAHQNIVRNGLVESIQLKKSNLFEDVSPDLRFDYILWNPPFYPRKPLDDHGRAWNAGEGYDVLQKFASDCSKYLDTNGSIILILSSDMDLPFVLALFQPLRAKVLQSRRRFFEVFTIFQLSR